MIRLRSSMRPLAELLEGLGGGGHGLVDAGEHAEAAGIAAAVDRRGGTRAHPRQHLLDNAANQFFGGLHGDRESLACRANGLEWVMAGRLRGETRSCDRRGPCR